MRAPYRDVVIERIGTALAELIYACERLDQEPCLAAQCEQLASGKPLDEYPANEVADLASVFPEMTPDERRVVMQHARRRMVQLFEGMAVQPVGHLIPY